MIRVGTSGWNYPEWQDKFYPEEVAQSDWLNYYQHNFRTIEINNTFYQLPEEQTFRNWYDAVEEGFVFAVKANRYITHLKNLLQPEEPVSKLIKRARLLGDKLGPILFQLPPYWQINASRLTGFVEALPPDLRFVFEFRHPSWYTEEVLRILRDNNLALCVHDHQDAPAPHEITADYLYLRFHGPSGEYWGEYTEEEMKKWAARLRAWNEEAQDVFIYFNNDADAAAIRNAGQLAGLL